MNNSEDIYQALKPDFAANLKEVNDLIDANIENSKIEKLAQRICANCYHYDAWHMHGGCEYRGDGTKCDCEGFEK